MRAPTVEDFGLRPEDVRRAESAKKVLIAVALFLGVLGLASVSSLRAYDGNYRGLLVLVLILVMPPYGPFIIYYSLKALLRVFWPPFNQAIRFAAARKAYENWWVRTQTRFWQSLSGKQFEHELAALFIRTGTQAEVTRASDDKGVDIWLNRNGRKVPVQCKAHTNPVGPAIAREFFGAMQHFNADEGILASLSGFTRGVHEYVSGKPIRLLTLSDILQMQKQLR